MKKMTMQNDPQPTANRTSGSQQSLVGPCPPDCGHSQNEHRAFDEGVDCGRKMGLSARNPYDPENNFLLAEAWDSGKSAGAQEYEPELNSRLEWKYFPVGTNQRGYLKGQPEITLFVIGNHEDKAGRKLGGAFVPDKDEEEISHLCLRTAKEAAEKYLDLWLEKNAYREIFCPNCYGGHQKPCQWCGDSGRVIQKTP